MEDINDNEIIDADIEIATDKKPLFKKVCKKIGIVVSVYFLCRILNELLYSRIYIIFPELGSTGLYAVGSVLSCVFVYLIPILFAVILFKSYDYYRGEVKTLYKRPVHLARALSNFPAAYGFGQAVNILTLIVFYIISLLGSSGVDVEKSFETMSVNTPDNIYSALIMTFTAVIIAPVLEEFWLRGIFYDALKPFGNGISILITSVVFGLMHSNLQMLFYTTALGFVLGYIRYATGSIFVSTIIHAFINSIAMVIMLFLSTDTFQKNMNLTNMAEQNSGDELLTVMFYIYLGTVLLLMLVGIISFFKKIKIVKRNKIQNDWQEAKPLKKVFIFLSGLPVILMIVLAVDAHFGKWIAVSIFELINK